VGNRSALRNWLRCATKCSNSGKGCGDRRTTTLPVLSQRPRGQDRSQPDSQRRTRIDGRDTRTVRPISIRTGGVACVHTAPVVHARRDAGTGGRPRSHARDERSSSLQGKYTERFCSTTTSTLATGETVVWESQAARDRSWRLAKRALLASCRLRRIRYSMRVCPNHRVECSARWRRVRWLLGLMDAACR